MVAWARDEAISKPIYNSSSSKWKHSSMSLLKFNGKEKWKWNGKKGGGAGNFFTFNGGFAVALIGICGEESRAPLRPLLNRARTDQSASGWPRFKGSHRRIWLCVFRHRRRFHFRAGFLQRKDDVSCAALALTSFPRHNRLRGDAVNTDRVGQWLRVLVHIRKELSRSGDPLINLVDYAPNVVISIA